MKRILYRTIILLLILAGGLWLFMSSVPAPAPPPVSTPPDTVELKQRLLSQLGSKTDESRPLDLPARPFALAPPTAQKTPPVPDPADVRAVSRYERKDLPLGVVLNDQTSVFESPKGKSTVYVMMTGDFVRVLSAEPSGGRIQIQPGVDVYLAQTSRQFEAAGNRFTDKPGWISADRLHIFKPEQAIDFTQTANPMTLGEEGFSTLAFYERAMKNPDPVVHRVVGPRLIDILAGHDEYVSAWKEIYRDPDSRIRSLALSKLKERGVGNNRDMIEDLIVRLSELTREKVRGETEAETLAVLAILKDADSPRVRTALESYKEAWEGKQSEAVLNALD